jgi:hypothetical protein
VNFFLFFEFGTAMIMMGFFLSTIIHKTTVASNAGMGLLIAGFFIQLVLGKIHLITYWLTPQEMRLQYMLSLTTMLQLG